MNAPIPGTETMRQLFADGKHEELIKVGVQALCDHVAALEAQNRTMREALERTLGVLASGIHVGGRNPRCKQCAAISLAQKALEATKEGK